jgi:arylsulfatase A-like enzyme
MNIDIFPTCLALSGLALPKDRVIDGRDLRELLTVPNSKSPHEHLFFYHHGELEGIREGRWKYFRSINHYVWPMPVNKSLGNLSEHTTGPLPLLFDLEIDPGEAYNLAGRHPEVASRLAEQMTRWEEQMQGNRKGWKT